jgi:PAS domain S-box-containing protein
MTVMTSMSYYLAVSKNAVIDRIERSKVTLLRKNEELKELSIVASGTTNSVIITDESGYIEWVNEGFTRLTGYSFEEAIGKKNSELFFGELTDSDKSETIDSLNFTERSYQTELIKYNKDKNPIWIQENITRIHNDENKVQYIFIENNITDRKKSEQRISEYRNNLEKTNMELDKFAYVVSHDLKAPLRAIGNLTGWIEEDAGYMLPDDVRSNFNLIKERVIRMEALINGILDYSKIAKKNSMTEIQDTGEIINEIRTLISSQYPCDIITETEMPGIYADKTKIEQIFMNLIGNAVKFNNKNHRIVRIRHVDNGDCHQFSVADNGPGIDSRFHDKVFQIFQTINSRDEFESTGVGLAIVKKIISEQNARVWIESITGEGTTFHFTWPKKDAVFTRTSFTELNS